MNRVDLKNFSRFETERLNELLEIARGTLETGHVALNVKNCSHPFARRAYCGIPRCSNRAASGAQYLVVARIGADEYFPRNHRYRGLKTSPTVELVTPDEAIVYLLAHELCHCQQFSLRQRRSEIQAVKVGAAAVERYRARFGRARVMWPCAVLRTAGEPGYFESSGDES